MVATVLVGKAQGSPGVIARIFNLREGSGSSSEKANLRNRIVDQWAMLHDSVVPRSTQEMVYRLSRHADSSSDIWTLIGCYSQAHFPDNTRGGTYIGCGVLERGQMLDPQLSLQYVLRVWRSLDGLKNPHGILAHSIYDVNEQALGIDTPELIRSSPQRKAGLKPGKRRLFLDLHQFKRNDEFEPELVELVLNAQWRVEFSDYWELIIGNSPALADRARQSAAYDVFSPEEWKFRKQAARGAALPAVAAGPRESAPTPVAAAPAVVHDHTPQPVSSQAETNWESVQQDIRSLALRLEHAESKLQQILAGPREKPATTAASLFGRGNWAVVLLLGTVLVVGVFVYLTRSAPSSVMQACAKVSLSTDALIDHEKRMAANEIQCLEAEADTAQRRIEVLRDALKRGDNRVTRAK